MLAILGKMQYIDTEPWLWKWKEGVEKDLTAALKIIVDKPHIHKETESEKDAQIQAAKITLGIESKATETPINSEKPAGDSNKITWGAE